MEQITLGNISAGARRAGSSGAGNKRVRTLSISISVFQSVINSLILCELCGDVRTTSLSEL